MRLDTRDPETFLPELVTDYAEENDLDAKEVAKLIAPLLVKKGREVLEQWFESKTFTLRRLALLSPSELKRFQDIQRERARMRQEVRRMFRDARKRAAQQK